MFGPMIL